MSSRVIEKLANPSRIISRAERAGVVAIGVDCTLCHAQPHTGKPEWHPDSAVRAALVLFDKSMKRSGPASRLRGAMDEWSGTGTIDPMRRGRSPAGQVLGLATLAVRKPQCLGIEARAYTRATGEEAGATLKWGTKMRGLQHVPEFASGVNQRRSPVLKTTGFLRVLDRAGEQKSQNPVNQAQVVDGLGFEAAAEPKTGKIGVNLDSPLAPRSAPACDAAKYAHVARRSL